jgi:hypothetical protein
LSGYDPYCLIELGEVLFELGGECGAAIELEVQELWELQIKTVNRAGMVFLTGSLTSATLVVLSDMRTDQLRRTNRRRGCSRLDDA